MKNKFKKGQKVSLLNDLTQELTVMSVYEEKKYSSPEAFLTDEMKKMMKTKYTLSNDTAYREEELVEYNPAIRRLKKEIEELDNKLKAR